MNSLEIKDFSYYNISSRDGVVQRLLVVNSEADNGEEPSSATFVRQRGDPLRTFLPLRGYMSKYYCYDKLLSRNALLNFVIGERGVGKSFGAKQFVINDFIKNGNEFVYLRRYKTELKSSVPRFFDDINASGIFEDHSFKVKNNSEFKVDGCTAGYAIALSTANILKSTSFAKVKTIIFDEFIIDKGCYKYLQNEVTQLLDIVETIARMRDVRVLMLGNAISITNPYFRYFELSLPYNSEFKSFKDGLIVVNYIKNEEYREAKKQTRFGKLIEDTEYGKYAIDNEFLRDSKAFIKKKSESAKLFSTIILSGIKMGVWRDFKEGSVYVSTDYDPSNPNVFVMNAEDHEKDEATILINARKSPWFRVVIESYRNGNLYFEGQGVKNSVMELLNKCLTY